MDRWASLARPLPPADIQTRDLLFQLLDCCQTKGSPHETVSTVKHPENPIVRLYGVTAEGYSVLVHCYNYEPYLWIKAPQNWLPVYSQTLMNELNSMLDSQTHVSGTVVRIELHKRRSIMYYQNDGSSDHLKIVVQLPQHIPKLRGLLSDRGVMCAGAWEGIRVFPTFESNVIFPLRFLVDNDIGGCNWLTVPAGKFFPSTVRTSTCQIEVCCSHEVVQNHEAVGQFLSIAPFRILSIDIECQGRKGFFPEPEKDPVIQIANHCINYGSESEPLTRSIFTLKSCGTIAGAQVYSYDTEEEMLLAWVRFVKLIDPDIFTGYNICNFDFPYLLNRGIALKINDAFHYWGRQINERTVARDKKFMSKQMGNREYTELVLEGRVIMDVMVVIQRDFKLRTYSLNAVSQNFLGEQKEDVHHSIIADLQQGTPETRRRLAVYCLKDALLPVKLLERLMIMVNNVEMARVTGVPIGWLLERGQQIKVFSMLLRKGKARNLVIPTVEYSGGLDQRGYEGATVIEPIKGFYNCPIATLDFASLYPSIIIAHNLCYSTLLRPSDIARCPEDMLSRTPTGDTFVKKELFPGVLPEVVQDLLAARKHAKTLMKNTPIESVEYKVLNGRQLALKVSANSVYGFTGAQVGKLPCLEVSSSVTSYGREMIDKTKSLVESLYNGVKVVYGDTDSVMIKCVTDESSSDKERLKVAMEFGKEAAEKVSNHFLKPIKLEFEKVYFPYLLMNKKRYAGLLWTNTEKYDKLDAKGIETVRRDNCPLVASIVSGVLNRILIQRSVESAVEYVKGTIRDLLLNRLDISHLVITKAFSKAEDEYAGGQAHIALVERMRKRDPASAPNIGDRVAYVIIRAAKGAKAYERSEDPIYVLDNNIPIDTQYYLEHQLAPPILRVFEGVLDDPSVLIKGEHTRHIAVSAPSKNAGGLMSFVKFQLQCISCRAVIKSGALCENCHHKEPDIYGKIVAKRNHYEAIYSQVWTQCQQCQGSLNQEVICTSKDCPVFYLRKKVQKDVREQQELLDRFGVVDDW
ncbi:DNA polymerase delta catalytic subunit [Trypanosoma theileri]|uniref:DNA polymerase n=1 Tax=Trypanosoma theileri TaxID=67003 RepID=A0A1X0P2A8_9TRYP|nr:DNA polymerase delta catalytic subunit [Trypanosoma theileri]ORC90659.1 DNA polymerase delta catalytic subunit [Trypanosoma theileri]